MDELVSMLAGDEPTAQEALAALSQKLRRQQAVGTLASLIGGPAKDFGASLTRQADQGLQQVAEAPGQRLRMALQRQQLAGEQEQAARAKQPVGRAMQVLLGKMAPVLTADVMQGMTEMGAEKILPAVGAYSAKEDAAKSRALTARLAAGAEPANTLTPEALDQLATQFAQTGTLPAMGFGKAAAAVRLKIANRAAELFQGNNLAQAKAGFGADAASLKKLQQSADAVEAFEATATANLDRALSTAKGVIDTGSPWFNKPARAVAAGLAGSPQLAAFQTARQVAANEVAKVLSGSMGNQALSDSARHEASALLDPDASLAQLEAAANILKQDMASRKTAFRNQLAEVRARTGGGGNTPAAPPITSTSGNVGELTPEEQKELEALRAHFGVKK